MSQLLNTLGRGPAWDGARSWQSLGGELRVEFRTDPFGHVAIRFVIAPKPWTPTWSASCVFEYDLGDLTRLAGELSEWFRAQIL